MDVKGQEAQRVKVKLDAVNHGDCLEGLAAMDAGSVDLVFADPPFNIGYAYDVYDDRKDYDKYLAWSRDWIKAVHRVLKPDGTFWLAIGDEYAAELKLIAENAYPGLPLCLDATSPPPPNDRPRRRGRPSGRADSTGRQRTGFICRSWVVWYYTFGVHCTQKFTRSHAHLFHFIKHPKKHTFNVEEIRVPSARQLVYADRRANPTGRIPDDTWMIPCGNDGFVRRPQDAPSSFRPEENTWYISRVCGTFSERQGWHGCQMPEQLLGRIIRASSNVGEIVLDPFAGSGTTLVVAKKLRRRFVGFEVSYKYSRQADMRLDTAAVGDKLRGPVDSVTSAPATRSGRATKGALLEAGELPFGSDNIQGGRLGREKDA